MPSEKFVNIPCSLLSSGENAMLFKSMGCGSVTIATGIVELHRTYEPDHNIWFREFSGILCFVYDKYRKMFFMRLHSLIGYDRIWEFRVPSWLTYVKTMPYFHQFEGKDCIIGLNFCNEEEAESFSKTVFNILEKIANIKKKGKKYSGAQRQKKVASKPIISGPTEFRHVEHFGLDKFQHLLEYMESLQCTIKRGSTTNTYITIQKQPEVIIRDKPSMQNHYQQPEVILRDKPSMHDHYQQPEVILDQDPPSQDHYRKYEKQQEIPLQNNLLNEIRNAKLKSNTTSVTSSKTESNSHQNRTIEKDCDGADSMKSALAKIMHANFDMDDDDEDDEDYSINYDSDWD